jgi:hypothetical protein
MEISSSIQTIAGLPRQARDGRQQRPKGFTQFHAISRTATLG